MARLEQDVAISTRAVLFLSSGEYGGQANNKIRVAKERIRIKHRFERREEVSGRHKLHCVRQHVVVIESVFQTCHALRESIYFQRKQPSSRGYGTAKKLA